MSFTLVTPQVILARNAGALYGLQLGNSTMSSLVTSAGSNVDALLNSVYAASVGSASTTLVATTLTSNLGLTGSAATDAQAYIVGQLNAVAVSARGAKVNEMLNMFSGMTSDATYGAAAAAYNSKISNAVAYAGVAGNTEADFSAASTSTGRTFTLTTGIDNFVGGSSNDVFQGDSANIGGLDSIVGGDGTDTALLTSTAAAVTLSGAQISGVEVLKFNAGTNAHTATLSGMTGVTTVENNGSSVALTVGVGANSLAALTAVNISNTSSNTTIVTQEAAVTGASDAQTVTVNAVTGAAQVNLDTQTATATVAGAIETLNVVSTGSVSNSITLESNDTQGVGAVNVSGSRAITIALGTNLATDAIVINAADSTGGVTVTGIGAGNNFAGTAVGHTITGGAGNDSFALGANYVGAENTTAASRDVINGGAGTDTLSITLARVIAANVAQTNLTSIEALTISDAWADASNIDITKFTDVTKLTLAAATAGTSTATINSGTTVVLAGDSAANSVTSFTVGGVGTSDSMTLNMAGFDFAGTGTETFTGIETLNINTGTTVTNAATFAAALTQTASAGGSASIVVTGVNAMTFTGVVTSGTIDASGLTGALTVTAAPANAIRILGGSAGDSITGSTAADTIVGNNGADTITSGTGADAIDLTETVAAADTIVTTIGAAYTTAAADVITGFTTGASGDILQIDISDSTAIANLDVMTAGNGATAIAGNLVIQTVAKGAGATTLAATTEALVITGTYASSAALLTDMGSAAGTTAISWSADPTDTSGLLVIWYDGTNTHVSAVSDSDAGANAAMLATELELTDLVILTGNVTGWNTANLVAVA